jgi:hypothetical protein
MDEVSGVPSKYVLREGTPIIRQGKEIWNQL